MQEDSLMSTATPREALQFSARLRLPPETSEQFINTTVEVLLNDLGLTKCSDTMIGGALVQGISGGERKRTSVGVELITNPSVGCVYAVYVSVLTEVWRQLIFLDEPTSGLDSYSAYHLVKQLRVLASFDTTVLCTIHQPSSEVFFLFDMVIFLNEGRVMYHGDVKLATDHFKVHGFECPDNYNPADFVLFVNQTETISTLETHELFVEAPGSLFEDQDPSVIHSRHSTVSGEKEVLFKSSFGKQLLYLTHREFIHTIRDRNSLAARFGMVIVMSILLGLIFFEIGSKPNYIPTNISSHFGGLMMVCSL